MIVRLLRKIMPEKMPFFAAASYAAGPVKIFMPQYKLMAKDISEAASGTILDIGTGPGVLPLEIGKLIPSARITGIDVSEKMIEIAQRNKKKYGLTNVDFMAMDANALSFDDNAFDMIISTDALHHWKHPSRIIDEMHRCLKPGGEAWIYDGFSGASNKDIDAYIAGMPRVFPLYSVARLILGIHGFSQKEYDTIIKDTVAKTQFRTCSCEQRGVMMRVRLRKIR
ncbi:MAG: class I SAM-dependent methyltransferase [Candidatus Omnitrophota bacterium]